MRSGARRGRWRLAFTALIAVVVVGLDQLTKQIVLDRLGPEGDSTVFHVIPGILRLLYVENTGAAFGFFRGNSAVLAALATAVVIFLLFYFRRAIEQSSWLALALGLQIGGAFGNIVDRLHHGFVVDFIDVPHWPTFNAADSAITIGVVILGVYLFSGDSPPATASNEGENSAGKPVPGDSGSPVAGGFEAGEHP